MVLTIALLAGCMGTPETPVSSTMSDGMPKAARPAFEQARDVLLEGTFVLSPAGDRTPTSTASFRVEKEYKMLQVELGGAVAGGFAAASPSIKVLDPQGDVVAEWSAGTKLVPPSTAPNKPLRIASIYGVVPGEYRIVMTGASTPFALSVLGLSGGAPDFGLTDLLGKGDVRLSEFLGRVVLVDLFMANCAPCKHAMEEFAPVYDEYPREVFEILSVEVTGASEDNARAFFERNGWTWYAGLDDGTVGRNYGTGIMPPEVTVVDANGAIIFQRSGGIGADELRRLIEHALRDG
ncbi:MAG TPA: TlpA disulfide reductase family protein [Candidatus Thermoplasmatota archaeon]|nr:TlpA disulfide reductase family protein [Candidatus Thermoplasmatota archaeon]